MVRAFSLRCVFVVFSAILLVGCTQETPHKPETGNDAAPGPGAIEKPAMVPSGETLFRQYCANCHPDGGNISDPRRPLYASALKRNQITRPEDIVRIMRHPLSRMIRFDESTLSDKDARMIAEYVQATFK